MKTNRIYRAAALLLVMAVATLGYLPRTFARYTAEAAGAASARVAKWDVSLVSPVPVPTAGKPDTNGAIKFNSSFKTKSYTVTIKNLSEVAALPSIGVEFGTGYGGMSSSSTRATVTFTRTDGGTAVAPGGSATYTMTVAMPSGTLTNGYTTARIVVTANQVD